MRDNSNSDLPPEMQEILERKARRRKLLAALPIHERIVIVITLQERFRPLMLARGKDYHVWMWDKRPGDGEWPKGG